MTQRRVPVLIVGAGPVGLTLANLLGRAGVETLLVEANATTSDSPRAILIDDETFRTFQAIGLADKIREKVVYGTGARYYSRSGRLIAAVRPMVGLFGFPTRSAFDQPILETILAENLRNFPSVQLRFLTRLVSSDTTPFGERVTLEGPDGVFTLMADWVVGCDGGRSTVREIAGIEMLGSSFGERWLIVDTSEDPDDSRFTKFICDASRPTVSVPAPCSGRRYEFMLFEGEDSDEMLSAPSISTLMKQHRDLKPSQIIRQVVYTFHALVAARFRDGRRLLLGDAAHMMPPFAGQGMNSGLRDAHNVSWKLVLCLRGVAEEGLLDTYEEERRPHVEAMIALSVQLGRIVMSVSRIKAWFRDTFFRALSLVPPAKEWVATMRWKPAPRYARGCLVAPIRGRIGYMLPQPMVTVGDGGAAPLDSRMGDGFALLGRDEASLAALSHPIWAALDARRVAVLSGERTPRGGMTVGDKDEQLAEIFSLHEGEILLVRPDRYIAGAFRPADEIAFADQLQSVLGFGAADLQLPIAV